MTSASSFGRLYTDTELTYDRAKRDIVRSSVEGANMPVTRDQKDAEQTSLIAHYLELVKPIASKEIGQITTDVKKDPPLGSTNGESQLGDLIADAQLADDSTVTNGKTPVIAFMNPGGIRTDLNFAQTNPEYPNEVPGDVTYEEAFSVQPFNNYLVSMDLTGQDIYDILAQQVTGTNARVAQDPPDLAGLHLQARPRRRCRGRLGEAERDADRQGGDLPDRDEQLPVRAEATGSRRSRRAPTCTTAGSTSTRSPTTCRRTRRTPRVR